ncbi:stage III sporulation protein AF [Paenibacillus terrigena]|uniref:stage III sporulation protein AF n=1 Tax=Paenibacillus terrigena TaxID=369333 RepID=UPI00037454B7|nr:stage III sporulation protein AF [Paenibacillus terrigena]
MMEWLGGWLKQIIFIILLATFIDLILPNRSMQRYVKLVISLLILVTIMTPILSIFRSSFADQLAENYTEMSERTSQGRKFVGVDQIMREGDRLKRKQEEKVIQSVETQLAAQIKTQLEEETGSNVTQVHVKIGNLTQDTKPSATMTEQINVEMEKPNIQSVEVYFDPSREQELKQQETGDPIAAMKPIEGVKVDIQLDPIGSNEDAATPVQADPVEEQTTPEERVLSDRAVAILKTNWGVSVNRINIFMGRDTKLH